MFMNYMAFGSGKTELHQGLVEKSIIWDVENHTAEPSIKDDGSYPKLSMTELSDVSKFVAAACDLPLASWKPTIGTVSGNIGVDEVLKLLEAKSGARYETKTVDKAKLEERASRIEGPGSNFEDIGIKLTAQMELLFLEEKEGMGLSEPTVNKLCLDVKPHSVERILDAVFA
jgi:hypothetical protein